MIFKYENHPNWKNVALASTSSKPWEPRKTTRVKRFTVRWLKSGAVADYRLNWPESLPQL
ncbi:hypothetical protein BN2497_7987 [Janthinobacterium sp. CG23_2]|nr:hypothetical protein BN2497_7987 [Janthinobacterium sp. CG23_2]CUU30391.1 hypothetical protein BN3177_7987 [Janthinobacterium sp. CG23_2]